MNRKLQKIKVLTISGKAIFLYLNYYSLNNLPNYYKYCQFHFAS